jgi:uncharacterized membrane protein YkoI
MKRTIVSVMCEAVVLIALATSLSQATQDGTKEEKVKPSKLPPAVAQAIKTNCTACTIDKATREIENGVTVYDIEFKSRQGEIAIAEDGFVVDRETVVQLKDVPAAALEAIQKAAAGGKIRQIAKGKIHAELKEGKIVKLGSPRYVYEAELQKGNEVAEIEVSPEGQVIEAPEWRKRGTKEN